MVDLTPDEYGNPRARLLDLVRPVGKAYSDWLKERGEDFRDGVGSPPSTRSTATRTPSTTSSRTPPPCSTPSMWSTSAPRPSTK